MMIGKNILKFRTDKRMTQAQLADYLCVSPQAVSKWEQGNAMPDITLIPKIAFFFNITTDALFGVTNFEYLELLISKYGAMKQETLYREAKEGIESLLSHDQEDVKALSLLSRLEHLNARDKICKCKDLCEKIMNLSGENSEMYHFAKVDYMKHSARLNNYDYVTEMKETFEREKHAKAFNYYILALLTQNQYEKIEALSQTYFEHFTLEDQYFISPNLMEASYALKDLDTTKFYFEMILKSNNAPQIFSAWWIMWRLYEFLNNNIEAETCRKKLLLLLPKQGYSKYQQSLFESKLRL